MSNNKISSDMPRQKRKTLKLVLVLTSIIIATLMIAIELNLLDIKYIVLLICCTILLLAALIIQQGKRFR